jgi:hypothetical protein
MKWIFVYNADSGVLNTAFDFAHKIISPDTYECSLCMLTYGSFTEKKVWKKFREEAQWDFEFLHKDQFERKNGTQFDYPIILEEIGDGFEVVLASAEMDSIYDVETLIEILNRKFGGAR